MIVGIDVSKEWLDLAVSGPQGELRRIENKPAAIATWLAEAQPGGLHLIAFEPTGSYENALVAALRAADVLHVRVHPNDVLAFRRSRGIKAKTDKIDARLIAAFAAEELTRRGLHPVIAGNPTLRELAARRRQLVDLLQGERCRLALATAGSVHTSLEVMILALETSLRTIEAELNTLIAADPATAQMAALLQSVKGIGPVTAMTLMADVAELGHLSGKEIAALIGLAPITRESGKTRYRAKTGHGRPGVRRVLFNAARCAIRHNPVMRDFYQRLVTQNKRPGKVALIAVMRKMLVTLNAIARDKQPWKHAGT